MMYLSLGTDTMKAIESLIGINFCRVHYYQYVCVLLSSCTSIAVNLLWWYNRGDYKFKNNLANVTSDHLMIDLTYQSANQPTSLFKSKYLVYSGLAHLTCLSPQNNVGMSATVTTQVRTTAYIQPSLI